MSSTEMSEHDVDPLVARWSEAAQLYINGDLRGYAALARHADDYTLFPPAGGPARRGFDSSDEAVEWTAENFRSGHAELEVSATYGSGDLAVLVAVERQSGDLGPVPPQDWSLRVTLVFRHDGAQWRLVHRHADPLVQAVDPALFAAIARGEHQV